MPHMLGTALIHAAESFLCSSTCAVQGCARPELSSCKGANLKACSTPMLTCHVRKHLSERSSQPGGTILQAFMRSSSGYGKHWRWELCQWSWMRNSIII